MSRSPFLILAMALSFLVPAGGVVAQQNRHGGGFRGGGFRGGPGMERGGFGRRGGDLGGGMYRAPYGRGFPGSYAPPPVYAPPPTIAQGWRGQQEVARAGVRRGSFAPLGSVIAGIRRRAPGRQLDTTIEDLGGRPVYRVRWITLRGRRIDFVVDAATGAILGER